MKPNIGTELDINWSMRAGLIVMVLGVAAGRVGAEDLPEGLVDPTRPSGAAMADVAEYHSGPVLQSTFISSGNRRAVISGRTYRVGDRVGSGVITDIQPYEVVLQQGARESRLRLLPKLTKEVQVLRTGTGNEEGRNK